MDTKAYDKFTMGVRSIDTDHSYIHDGIGFVCTKVFSLGNAAVQNCILTTPAITPGGANVYIHIRPASVTSSASAVIVNFYEGCTYTGGTPITGSFNRNRNSSNNTSMILIDGSPTVSSDGTLLTTNYIGVGGTPSQVAGGGLSGTFEELVLKPSTNYLLRFTNQTSTTTTISAGIFWYEEEMGV